MNAIVTVIGKDKVGIIAAVCALLAENNVNILDISQTIVSGYFNMMMITDISGATKDVAEISQNLKELGQDMGLVIRCQLEDIFTSMHRI